jgi:hypothetical protein
MRAPHTENGNALVTTPTSASYVPLQHGMQASCARQRMKATESQGIKYLNSYAAKLLRMIEKL